MFTVDVWYHDLRTDRHGFYEREDFEYFEEAMKFFNEQIRAYCCVMTEYDIDKQYHIRNVYQRKYIGCEECIIITLNYKKIES